MSFRAAREIAAGKDRTQQTKQNGGTPSATTSTSDSPTTRPSSTPNLIPASRLCVKNLPVHVKEERLRAVFGEKGEVTDVKLLKTADGRSRKMAFIGFRTIEAATIALKHFNKTFIDTSRIDVEYAVNPREAKEVVQPWSRHSEGSSRWNEQHGVNKDGTPLNEKSSTEDDKSKKPSDPISLARAKAASSKTFSQSALYGLSSNTQLAKLLTDPKFKEYLHVMSSRSKNKFWSNTTMDEDGSSGGRSAEDMAKITGEKSYQTYEEYLKEQKKGERKGKGKGKGENDDDEDDEDDEYFNQPMLDRDTDEKPSHVTTTKAPTVGTGTGGGSDDDEDAMDTTEATTVDPLLLNQSVSDLDYLKSKQGGSGGKNFDEDSDIEEDAGATATGKARQKVAGSKRKATNEAPETDDAAAVAAAADEDADEEEGGDSSLRAAYESDLAQSAAEAAAKTEADEIMDSGRLFLRNLSYTVTEDDLRTLFKPFGSLSEIHLPLDDAKKPKGFALISFTFPAHALAAQRSLDGMFFLGRLLHILNGRPKPSNKKKSEYELMLEMGDDAKSKLTYKKRKELEMQAFAGSKKDQASWNTLFLRSDTVTDAIATKYGLQKSDILDTTNEASGDSNKTGMAVRLALAETTLINETKNFLKDHGINIELFDLPKSSTQRSEKTLIVKNLPPQTDLDELRRLFGKYGSISHILMPPSKTLCFIDFQEAQEAKQAFKNLAYKKFKFVPLYLEWAPKGAFVGGEGGSPSAAATTSGVIGTGKKATEITSATATADDDSSNNKSSTESCTVYVKNLNFSTTETSLSSLFTSLGYSLRSCSIQMKKNTRVRPGTSDPSMLSMGYGFVEFRTHTEAKKAITQLQGAQLDNHALELKLSSRGTSTTSSAASSNVSSTSTKPRTPAAAAHVAAHAAATGSDGSATAAPSSKLLIKNVPFETTARELRELFAPFGAIQRIRLPKKFGQLGHRGFAFIDFSTKSEAKNAYENVRHSHLYGRHLVIEYAAASIEQDSQDVEGLRKKTQEQYAVTQGGAPPHKKRKVADADEDEIDQAFEKQFK